MAAPTRCLASSRRRPAPACPALLPPPPCKPFARGLELARRSRAALPSITADDWGWACCQLGGGPALLHCCCGGPALLLLVCGGSGALPDTSRPLHPTGCEPRASAYWETRAANWCPCPSLRISYRASCPPTLTPSATATTGFPPRSETSDVSARRTRNQCPGSARWIPCVGARWGGGAPALIARGIPPAGGKALWGIATGRAGARDGAEPCLLLCWIQPEALGILFSECVKRHRELRLRTWCWHLGRKRCPQHCVGTLPCFSPEHLQLYYM